MHNIRGYPMHVLVVAHDPTLPDRGRHADRFCENLVLAKVTSTNGNLDRV